MRSFDQFLAVLNEIPDPRRAEGKLYKLPYLLLFSVPAVITGGNSFRSIETFIKVHCRRLNAAFGLHCKRAPAHTAIPYILQGLDPREVEWVFRRHAAVTDPSRRTISCINCWRSLERIVTSTYRYKRPPRKRKRVVLTGSGPATRGRVEAGASPASQR